MISDGSQFHSSLLMKWIKPGQPGSGLPSDLQFSMVSACLLTATDSDNRIEGFVVCEPRSLDSGFFDRLRRRMSDPKSASSRFQLFIPEFLSHRVPKDLPKLEVTVTPWFKVSSRGSLVRVQSRVRVVCVDDSPLLLKVLSKSLGALGFVEVVSLVSDPLKAKETIERLRPDIVTMDIQMPKMTGVEVVSQLMETMDIPIIMVSSMTFEDGTLVFDALNAGAFDYVQKPSREELESFQAELQEKFLSALEGRNRHSSAAGKSNGRRAKGKTERIDVANLEYPSDLIWCIGSSTGGTQALTQILTRLPSRIPPTLIVQHIPPVFSAAFAKSLNDLCPFTVKEAEDGDRVMPDHVYVAPGGQQMMARREGKDLVIRITDDAPVNRFKPSVDYLFSAVSQIDRISLVAGILTGMGRDGAAGLLKLKEKGARTFAQDQESSAVFGMPRAAIENGAAQSVLGLDQIAVHLIEQSSKMRKSA